MNAEAVDGLYDNTYSTYNMEGQKYIKTIAAAMYWAPKDIGQMCTIQRVMGDVLMKGGKIRGRWDTTSSVS